LDQVNGLDNGPQRGAPRRGRGFHLLQQLIDIRARHRPGEQVALHLVAAGEPQQHPLLLGLDPFGEDGQAEHPPERDDLGAASLQTFGVPSPLGPNLTLATTLQAASHPPAGPLLVP